MVFTNRSDLFINVSLVYADGLMEANTHSLKFGFFLNCVEDNPSKMYYSILLKADL